MDLNIIKLVFHKGGRWVRTSSLQYIEGSKKVEKGDIDFLSFTHMLKKYRVEFEMPSVNKLCYVKPEEELTDNNVMILENDDGINDIVATVLEFESECVIHIYPFDEIVVRQPLLDTQCSVVGMSSESQVSGFVTGQGSGQIHDKGKALMDDWGREMGDENEVEFGAYTILKSETKFNLESDRDSSRESSDLDTESNSDSDVEMALISQSRRHVKYDVDDNNPHFLLGMSFANAKEARLAITKYSIAKSTPLKLNPNEKHRIRAKCKGTGCPFVLYMSSVGNRPDLTVRTFISEHNCLRNAKNRLASSRFLASEFKDVVNDNPNITTKELMKKAETEMHLYVSRTTCKRAKKKVKTELDGSYVTQYECIAAYTAYIKKTNPGTTAELELSEEALLEGRFVFKRLYFCFDALKRGWKVGCRPIIGLDGCHLKGIVKGQILVAVGRDAADQIYPIAWAVCDKENILNWKWFLELLVKDLEISDSGNCLTVISDMQKGLVNAVGEVLPLVEHRYCARHVHANWSKKWHSGELRKRFWICVWSNFKEEFDDNLRVLGSISKEAAEDFVAYNPQVFCRAFFSSRCKSDIVDNNFCESFNASIRNARFKPIISMLDEIRECAMARLATHMDLSNKWTTNWSTTCMDRYQANQDMAFGCKVVFNGENGYEVGDRDDRHVVRMDALMCTCRYWDVTGIPCCHAICAINYANKDPKSYISHWYEKTTYMATYQVAMQPVPDLKFMDIEAFEKCEPPPTVRLSGRPRVKRIRSAREKMKGQSSGSLGRKGVIIKCSICQGEGHNKAKCPEKLKENEKLNVGEDTHVLGKRNESASGEKKAKAKDKSLENSKCTRRTKSMVGMGLFIDPSSGNTTLNPGMSSETIIMQRDPIASQALSFNPDPNISFPIPNEKEIRQEQRALFLAKSSASRKIAFAATGTQSILPTNLPFKPPGPTWKGKACITRSQLEKLRDKKSR